MLDLTHSLNNTISVYPGTEHPKFKQISTIKTVGYNELNITMRTHSGTHIDAPSHIIPNAKSLDKFPIDHFIGQAIVLDCSKENSITLDFLKEKKDKIKGCDFVLFYTSWQQKWNSDDYFSDFPTLTAEAAKYLIQFKLKAIGFDHISADKMDSTELPIHNLLLENEILIIENLNNLDQLIAKQFELNCIPLKIENTDGAPIRAFARNIK